MSTSPDYSKWEKSPQTLRKEEIAKKEEERLWWIEFRKSREIPNPTTPLPTSTVPNPFDSPRDTQVELWVGCLFLIILCVIGLLVDGGERAKERASVANLEIGKINDLFAYYDTEFMRKYTPRRGGFNGYTRSKTPPDAEVETIEEQVTFYTPLQLDERREISHGRKIPRSQVIPIPARHVRYLELSSARTSLKSYYYIPPSTASKAEQEEISLLRRQ